MTLLKVKTLPVLFSAMLKLFQVQQDYVYLNRSRNDAQFSQYPLIAVSHQVASMTFQ